MIGSVRIIETFDTIYKKYLNIFFTKLLKVIVCLEVNLFFLIIIIIILSFNFIRL